jgi:topoisomerase-4 subunit A
MNHREAEVVTISLTAQSTAKKKQFEYDFSELMIKGRNSKGNLVTKYPVRKVNFKSAGVSTLGGVDIWYTPNIGRLNRDEHGDYIGNFEAEDKVLVIYKTGEYELTNFELTNHYEPRQVMLITKFAEKKALSAVYYDGSQRLYLVKRFHIETSTMDKRFNFLTEHNRTELLCISYDEKPRAEFKYKKDRKSGVLTEVFKLEELVDVRGWKAQGNRLALMKINSIKMLEPEEPEEIEEPEEDDEDENNTTDNVTENSEKEESPTEKRTETKEPKNPASEENPKEVKKTAPPVKKPKDDGKPPQLGLF